MKIIKVDKNFFDNNADFFKENLGFVYGYDTEEGLKKLNKKFNKKTFENVKKETFENIYNGHIKFFDNNENFLIIACENNKIYSIASFEILNNNWYLDGMCTRFEKRHCGLATQVLKEGLKHLNKTVLLHVDKDNLTAQALYEKFGFKPEHKIKLDFAQNSLLMSKNMEE